MINYLRSSCSVVLRIKLRLGLKLCNLLGRFLGRVNKVNYGVNYKFRQVTCRITWLFFAALLPNSQSFSWKSPPFFAIHHVLCNGCLLGHVGLRRPAWDGTVCKDFSESESSVHKSISSSFSTGNTALNEGGVEFAFLINILLILWFIVVCLSCLLLALVVINGMKVWT